MSMTIKTVLTTIPSRDVLLLLLYLLVSLSLPTSLPAFLYLHIPNRVEEGGREGDLLIAQLGVIRRVSCRNELGYYIFATLILWGAKPE